MMFINTKEDTIRFCPKNCLHLAPNEKNQSEFKERHLCQKYDTIVHHYLFHPELVMLKECTVYDKQKVNWWKTPFEIMAMFSMTIVWGSEATLRMIASETKYQRDNETYVNMVCGVCGKEACYCPNHFPVPEKLYKRRKV